MKTHTHTHTKKRGGAGEGSHMWYLGVGPIMGARRSASLHIRGLHEGEVLSIIGQDDFVNIRLPFLKVLPRYILNHLLGEAGQHPQRCDD
jgi:hypothetical protein